MRLTVCVLCLQELRMRRVAQEHIDAALEAVFGDSKQIAGMEPSDEQQEGAPQLAVDQAQKYMLPSMLLS